MRAFRRLTPWLYACALSACAAELREPEDEDDLTPAPISGPTTADGLIDKGAGHFETAFNTWDDDGFLLSEQIATVEDFFCVLSRVRGDYSDNGWAEVKPHGTHWIVTGRGAAICTPRSNFQGRGANGQLLSAPIVAESGRNGNGAFHRAATCGRVEGAPNTSGCTWTWWGDAISFINKVSGEMNDGGNDIDGVWINQSTGTRTNSRLFAMTTETGTTSISGSALSFFVGDTSLPPQLVRLRGYNSNGSTAYGNAASTGTFSFSVASGQGFNTLWMASAGLSVCGLTRIAGVFDDGGESLRIFEELSPDGVRWWRVTAAATDGGSVRGAARCMAYNQG